LCRNKDEISRDKLSEADIVIFGGPRDHFSELEFTEIKAWLNSGGRALILLADGGERAGGSNMNTFLHE
jgi:intraflagellar transport protein 52